MPVPVKPALIGKLLLFFALLISVPVSDCHAEPFGQDDIVGVWEVQSGDAHVGIVCCGEKRYCGSIVWLKEPHYPSGDSGGMAGKPLLDRKNPRKELRSRPLVGLQMMDGYTFRGDNLWEEGRIYNPESGKTYSSRISLKSRDVLQLRGYIKTPLLGGSTVWKRVQQQTTSLSR